METKYIRKIEKLKNVLNCFGVSVDVNGKAGGLALLWRKDVDVRLLSMSRNHIDVMIENEEHDWRFTCFYGELDATNRHTTWELLHTLSKQCSKPWLCAGDYNELLCSEEKVGMNDRPLSNMRKFMGALPDSNLVDIGYTISDYMWCNRQLDPGTVWERLDRACCNILWTALFENGSVHHIDVLHSDHLALLIFCSTSKEEKGVWKKKYIFKFEGAWEGLQGSKKIVEKIWRDILDGDRGTYLVEMLGECKEGLNKWNSIIRKGTKERFVKITGKINNLRKGRLTHESKLEEKELKIELE